MTIRLLKTNDKENTLEAAKEKWYLKAEHQYELQQISHLNHEGQKEVAQHFSSTKRKELSTKYPMSSENNFFTVFD